METKEPFRADARLRDLMETHSDLMMVAARFGISFGFGDKTVREVCREDGVDCPTFLAVANLIAGRRFSIDVSLPQLMGYLRSAHSYFLDYLLPSIRQKLIASISISMQIDDVMVQLLRYFDDYCKEVRRHMEHENIRIFEYVGGLLAGGTQDDFRIGDYSEGHTSMTDKLNELKDVFIRHYHVKDNLVLVSALNDIIACNDDLCSHCEIEDRIFMPAVVRLEKGMKLQERAARPEDSEEVNERDALVDSMTEREKEIIRCVARGLSNKEIAERLFISINTVTTYRRNISAKLNIHSPAGLTVFAILHRLVDINDIDPHM